MSKKISFFILVLLFLLFLSVGVSASEVIPYDSEHYVEFINSDGNTRRICTNEDFYTTLVWSGSHEYLNVYSLATEEFIPCAVYRDGSSNVTMTNGSAVLRIDYFDRYEFTDSKGTVFCYGNEDNEGINDVFFHQAPRLVEIVVQERGAMRETLLQIVKILPMILVVVVSFLGLRKCFSFLSTFLHKA